MLENVVGYKYAACLGLSPQSCRDIDPVAIEAAAFNEDAAEADPNSKDDPSAFWYFGVNGPYPFLQLNRAADGTGE